LVFATDMPRRRPNRRSSLTELIYVLRDAGQWQDVLDYIDSIPDKLRSLSVMQEQPSLAESKTGDHFKAIAVLEKLIEDQGCPRRAVGHRRACASLVASFAAGAREAGSSNRSLPHRSGALIATVRCNALARRGAFVISGASLPGEGGAAYIIPRRAAGHRRACADGGTQELNLLSLAKTASGVPF